MIQALRFFLSLVAVVAGCILLYVFVLDMARAPTVWNTFDYTCSILGVLLFAGGVTSFWHQRQSRKS